MRTWTLLLTGPANGLVGPNEEAFSMSPAHYERVEVVSDEDLAHCIDYAKERLAHDLENLPGNDMSPEAELILDHFSRLIDALSTREAGQA